MIISKSLVKDKLTSLYPFYIDLRAISLARIFIGIIVLIDIIEKINHYQFYYSDTGIFTRQNFIDNPFNQSYFSILLAFDSTIPRLAFFGVSLFAATGLILGYKTKWSSFLCWIVLLSFHNRNIYLNQGGDDLLRMLLLIGIFMPWNSRYSIDKWNETIPESPTDNSFAGFAWMLQLGIMYVMSGILKTGSEWTQTRTAIYHVFELEQLTRPLGHWALNFPAMLKTATLVSVYLEKFSFVFFLIPLRWRGFRNAGILLIISFHLVTMATMRIGIFPWVSIAALSGLLVYNNGGDKNCWKRPEIYFQGILSKLGLGILMGITLWFQFRYTRLKVPQLPYENQIIYTFRLDHYWGMFAPDVYKNDGWFIMDATFMDRSHADLLTQKPVTNMKPDVYAFYKNDRYRKLLENIYTGNYVLRKNWIQYQIKQQQQIQPKKIIHVRLVYMLDLKGADDFRPHLIQPTELFETDIN